MAKKRSTKQGTNSKVASRAAYSDKSIEELLAGGSPMIFIPDPKPKTAHPRRKLSFKIQAFPSAGANFTIEGVGTINRTTGEYSWTPNQWPDDLGSHTVKVTVTVGTNTNSDTFSINVDNKAPIVSPIATQKAHPTSDSPLIVEAHKQASEDQPYLFFENINLTTGSPLGTVHTTLPVGDQVE